MFNQRPEHIVQTNRLPFIIGLTVLVFVMGFFMYKTQMNQKHETMQIKPKQSIDISLKPSGSGWFNEDKFKNIKIYNNPLAVPKQTPKAIEQELVSNQQMMLKKQELEDAYATQLAIQKMEDKNKIDDKKLELEAMRSPLSIDVPTMPGAEITAHAKQSNKDDLTGSLNQLMNMVKASAGNKIPELSLLSHQLGINTDHQDEKQDFLKSNEADGDYLNAVKKKPRSSYEVKAGAYIPAALITGINSDLPGQVNAQVTENVYDSITGNYLLIPQGAKLVGQYNSSVTYGQQRVQVVWDRIIFPDGSNINLEKMQGVDRAGYTGLHDQVDNHYLRIYGNAILLSLMGAGYDILNKNAQQSTDARETVAASVGQKIADISNQVLAKNMEVQPTLVINPGYKFKIFVMKDMVLEKIKDAEGTLAYSK